MLYIPYNLLLKPGEFNKPEWIKKGSLGVYFFFFYRAVKVWFSRQEMGENMEIIPGRLFPSLFGVRGRGKKKAPFFCSFAFSLQNQLGSLG